MRLLLDVTINELKNDQEDSVVEGLCEFLNKKYGRDNVVVDVNEDTEYDEDEVNEPDDEKE
jgi:hypothetical protein